MNNRFLSWVAILLAAHTAKPAPAQRATDTAKQPVPLRKPAPKPPRVSTYANPVYAHDFPDPFILPANGKFYAYATHGGGFGFQVMESPDMVHWTHKGTAFSPPWATEHYWAPEVIAYRGKYYMTYSAKNPDTKKHDIGIAVADSPLGPFQDRAMLVRGDVNKVGVIDTTVLVDRDKTPYLLYSEEDPRRIVLRKMSDDLMRVDDEVIELVHPDRPEDRGVTEAPTLLYRNGMYHLFYSSGWFQSYKKDACYAVYHATSRTLRGPYVKDAKPILATIQGKVYGPGHQSVFTLNSGEMWIAYHAWDDQKEPLYGSNPLGRTLRIDRLLWRGNTPYTNGPTTTPQTVPHILREFVQSHRQ